MRERDLNFILVSKAFEREGWTKHHQFMVGDKWKKGNDKVTCCYGHFKLNGTVVRSVKIL